MSLNTINAGYVRINQAMTNLMGAYRKGNRDDVVRVASHLMEDCDNLIGAVYEASGVTEEDILRVSSSEDQRRLTKEAMWVPGQPEDFEDIPFPKQ
ncbi:MAG: hypothetical protein M0R32_12265 [Candidatus Cloacimonetes bacterium]|jgi:hypothetical protein|nr:hypothetical protein [Candidatus Cloacimonadota bacterium]